MSAQKNFSFAVFLALFAALPASAVQVTPIKTLKDQKVDIVRAAFASVMKPSKTDPKPIAAPLKRIPRAYFRAASFEAGPEESLEAIAEALLLARMPPAPRLEWRKPHALEANERSARALAASLWTSYGYDPTDASESGAFQRLFPRIREIADPDRGTMLLEGRFVLDAVPYYAVVIVDSKNAEALALVAGSTPKPTPEPKPE